MNCMGRQDYETDVVMYTVDTMDPDVKEELLTSYDTHLQLCKRHPLTQTRVFQELLIAATAWSARF